MTQHLLVKNLDFVLTKLEEHPVIPMKWFENKCIIV